MRLPAVVLVLAPFLVAPSCTGSYASRGGFIGGAIGAGTGAIIDENGSQTLARRPAPRRPARSSGRASASCRAR